MTDPVALAEAHWHIRFQKVGHGEYRSLNGCVVCGDGGKGSKSDRFRLFVDSKPRVWCRSCGYQLFLDSLEQDPVNTAEWRLRALERKQQELERKQREHEERLSALERIHRCSDHLAYHGLMTQQQREHWYKQGIFDEAINRYQLGFCARCPTDTDHRSSFTIPITRHGRLENIRHRLVGADGGDKYRPHIAGLGLQLFNADVLDAKPERVLIVEGEKKAIVFDQAGFVNVGITGKSSFYREWLPWFDGIKQIIVALDPDATESAHRLAAIFGERARVAGFPVKPDDFITQYGAGAYAVESILACARRVASA